MIKPAVNYHGLLGLLQNFEKDHQLHKESVNVVGGSSSDRRPFKKEKKNKKVQLHAGTSAQGQTKSTSPTRARRSASFARSRGTGSGTVLYTLPPWT